MAPLNRYSLLAALGAACAGALWRPELTGYLGLAALALAVHIFVWDSERDEVFDDAQVEMCHAYGSLGLLGGGAVLLLIEVVGWGSDAALAGGARYRPSPGSSRALARHLRWFSLDIPASRTWFESEPRRS